MEFVLSYWKHHVWDHFYDMSYFRLCSRSLVCLTMTSSLCLRSFLHSFFGRCKFKCLLIRRITSTDEIFWTLHTRNNTHHSLWKHSKFDYISKKAWYLTSKSYVSDGFISLPLSFFFFKFAFFLSTYSSIIQK